MSHLEHDDTILARALKDLADIEAATEAPSRIEAAVMAHWDRRSRAKADRARAVRFIRGAATTAAGITLVGALMWPRGANESAAVATPPMPAPDATAENLTRYTTVAVVGGPLMADEPIRVVRMRVERSALGELGISSASRADGNNDSVDIDVLVGEDGVARGVRVPIREL
jgi:hypothetical protein